MELRHLRYFQALAHTLNFTRAAERLHIAQPPLSRQIQQLEDELGVQLLERARPLRLTEAGRYFHEHSSTLLHQLDTLCENTRRIGQGKKTWMGIGFAPSTLYGVLPELIRRLRSPDTELELELGLSEMTTVQQVEALKAGRIDVGFGRIHIDDPAVMQTVLREDRLIAVLPAGHPLLGRTVSLADLAHEPFVLYPGNPRPSYADHVLALFSAHGLSIKVAQWTNELQTAIGLIAAGIGITLVPETVQVQHRDDIGYVSLVEANATSPIILSRRVGDVSPGLVHCLAVIQALRGEAFADTSAPAGRGL
ncbi:MAG: LysR family transcriptional regulator [Pseudomonas sp.]|nr:LysR family transcriptional regulator [Pseudomonas sp.]